jgi:hypothetical protein
MNTGDARPPGTYRKMLDGSGRRCLCRGPQHLIRVVRQVDNRLSLKALGAVALPN